MIIADTGFWVTLIDQKDSYHAAADQALRKYNEPLITTWPVMAERQAQLDPCPPEVRWI
ncbi:PIN domain-containing protein [Leptolyngbya ectocarpi]|uniref:hypothetical protein n=1 Tax=Leptolyngbya ectocarpi TaxID=1202 RepID=UPI00188236A0|nr:hypothetical protein [Leptolyngbya ectocarpi]